MNPIVIAGGIIALLLLNRKSKAQTQMPQSSAPVPSPANPSGLDKPTGPSTTSDPIASPANPAGLDVPSEPISSPANPDVLEKDVEPAGQYEVVSDGNWTPSPANPKGLEEELMLDTSTPVSSPANPKGLVDIIISNEESKSDSSSSDPIASPANPKGLDAPTGPTTNRDPQTGLSLEGANTSGNFDFGAGGGGRVRIGFNKNYPILNKRDSVAFEKLAKSYGVGEPVIVDGARLGFGSYQSFVNWLLGQTGFTSAQAGKGKLAQGPYTYRVYLLAKQKGILNEATIEKYLRWREKRIADYKLSKQKRKEIAAKPKPKVLSGGRLVLDEKGNYVAPTSQASCPIGYKFFSFGSTKGCFTPERYAEIMIEKSRDVNLLPVRLTYWEGTRNGRKVTNSRLFSKNITFKEGQFNNLVKGYGLTSADSLDGLTDYFEHRGVFWGKKDGKWVALYQVKVRLNNGKRVKRYVVYDVTKEEYDYYKDVSKYYQQFLSNKK